MKNKETMHTNNPNKSNMTHNTIIIRLVTLYQLLTYKGGKINKYWNNSEINTELMKKRKKYNTYINK